MQKNKIFFPKHKDYILSFIFAVQISILFPMTLYLTNISEMEVSIGPVLHNCTIVFLVLALLFSITNRLITPKLKNFHLCLLCIGIICSWVQFSLIAWDYGVFDGRSFELQDDYWKGLIDLSIWLTIAAGILKLSKQHLNKFSYICTAIFVMQTGSICVKYLTQYDDDLLKQEFGDQEQLANIYRFSPEKNVIHILVDGLQSDILEHVLKYEPLKDRYENTFTGFTLYSENLGVFPYTRFSVPSFLGANIYKNNTIKNKFIDEVISGENIFSTAKKQGFELDIASGAIYWVKRYSKSPHNNIFNLDKEIYGNPSQKQTAFLLDISLFRLTPHFFKGVIYSNQKWLLKRLFTPQEGMQHWYFKHTSFLRSLITKMDTTRKKPVYKYIHIMNTHNPMVVDQDCNYLGQVVGMDKNHLAFQTRCTIETLTLLMQTLKQHDIYDSSLILIHGDHGGWPGTLRHGAPIKIPGNRTNLEPLRSLASPGLLIKPINNTGKLKKSTALTSLIQIPDTISTNMAWGTKFGYPSLSEKGIQEPRKFYFYEWQRDAWESDHTGPIFEFTIDGSHFDTEWRLTNTIMPPK